MIFGKRKMNSILSRETGLPYRDISVYGRYRKNGNLEKVEIGAHELVHNVNNDALWIWEPDYSDEDMPKYTQRMLEKEEGRDVY